MDGLQRAEEDSIYIAGQIRETKVHFLKVQKYKVQKNLLKYIQLLKYPYFPSLIFRTQ